MRLVYHAAVGQFVDLRHMVSKACFSVMIGSAMRNFLLGQSEREGGSGVPEVLDAVRTVRDCSCFFVRYRVLVPWGWLAVEDSRGGPPGRSWLPVRPGP